MNQVLAICVDDVNPPIQVSPVEPNIDVVVNVEPNNSSVQVIDDDDLIGVIATSEEDVFDIYNNYAFKLGFSVRKSKQRCRADNSIAMKRYLCSNADSKRINPTDQKAYSKLDVRTNCPALVQYDIDKDGVWVITKHVKDHNHELCPASSSYPLRSHRRVSKNQIAYLKELQKSGVGVADGVRVLKNQSGGSPFVGFGIRDAYNALSNSKILDGTDSNTLIQIFRNRQANEKDFFFDFKLDNESRLCSLFWRDGRMKQDYVAFGDLLVHDTTYRTNKYDMICAPFVGMNHHGMNVIFGCGFLLNERIESFEWLFQTFLRSMGSKHPVTIMTDQSASMAAAISMVFSLSRHRLCIWYIGENSKKHIRALRCQKNFTECFNYLLKDVESVAKFEHCWELMTTRFQCKTNKWLTNLYSLKDKWCPALSKNWFSGGALSSQRSENTNHSISRRLTKTAGLCDFYNCFVTVIFEWRSKQNGEDVRCIRGKPAMALSNAKLLLHARDVYTIEVFGMFEKQFMKGSQCDQLLVSIDVALMKYHVWVDGIDKIKHQVQFAINDMCISCTCKLFEEVGILCCHCLRILNIHCIHSIPELYILRRWRKDIVNDHTLEDDLGFVKCHSANSMAASLWRIQISRKFYKLISSSEENATARLRCEEAFEAARFSITNEVGPIYFDDTADVISSSSSIIQNPQSTSLKNQRNRRPKSTIEKKCNQAQGKRKRARMTEISNSMDVENVQVDDDSYIVHPSSRSTTLDVISPNTSSTFIPLAQFPG